MKKYILTGILFFFVFASSVIAWDLDTSSENILLYNLKDNKIIYEQNSNDDTKIASLTKIVTVLVALENIENISDKVVLTEEVFAGLEEADASVAGFKLGETVTYEDLLYGALLPSGADATNALAINIFKSEKNFVNKMNDLMTKLNITNTYFTNTSGLDEEGQKATLKDLLTIMLYAFKNEKFVQIFNSSKYTTNNGRLTFRSTLNYYQNKYDLSTGIIKGSKTGYTNLAGLCLLSYAEKDGLELLLITTNAPVMNNRYPYNVTDALEVYNYYFDNYSYQKLLKKNQVITSINTKYSKNKKVDLIYKDNDFNFLIPKDYNKDDISFEIDKIKSVSFKTNLSKPIGSISIYYQNKKITDGNLYLKEKVDFSLLNFIIYYIWLIIVGFILLIIYKNKLSHKKN